MISTQLKQAKAALKTKELEVIADRGYFDSEEIRTCHDNGITPIVPKCTTSGAKAAGRFDKADFIYDKEKNENQCPAGQRLVWRFTSIEHGLNLNKYWSSHCPHCQIKAKCTPSDYRRVSRWEHEDILDAMQTRLDKAPDTHAHPTANSGTSIWHSQSLDGVNPLFDQDSGSSQH